MSDPDIAEILKLPREGRFRLAEIIWASLASNPASVPLGDAHRAAIDERLAELERERLLMLVRHDPAAQPTRAERCAIRRPAAARGWLPR